MVKPPGADAGGRAACGTMASMETIKRHDTGAAVEDVQQRLATIGLLDQAAVDGSFGEQTAAALSAQIHRAQNDRCRRGQKTAVYCRKRQHQQSQEAGRKGQDSQHRHRWLRYFRAVGRGCTGRPRRRGRAQYTVRGTRALGLCPCRVPGQLCPRLQHRTAEYAVQVPGPAHCPAILTDRDALSHLLIPHVHLHAAPHIPS